LRQRLHERFDQWLDMLALHLDDEPMSLPDLTDAFDAERIVIC
jgi:hypothetical protein